MLIFFYSRQISEVPFSRGAQSLADNPGNETAGDEK